MMFDFPNRRRFEQLSSAALSDWQLSRLNELLAQVLPANSFYARKFSGIQLPLESLDEIAKLPFTFKEELVSGGVEHRAANSTWPIENYVRFHRTSGTHGHPLAVLDTADDWRWWLAGWQFVLDAACIESQDRALLAFSFGPFIGFWTAHDALVERGALVIPGGGLSSLARLELAQASGATALFCTPTYALHLAEVADEHKINTAALGIRKLVVAGEPGGSIPETRRRIERTWGAQLVDHAGATEVGPWGYSDSSQRGLHVNEALFFAEFLSVETGSPAGEGELAELVLTTLGRAGSPVIRYRTGDLVRPVWNTGNENRFVLLEGGVVGRADDMVVVRGVNVFPSSVAAILHGFPEVVEYRLIASRESEMDALALEVEDRLERPERIAQELRLRLGLQIDVRLVALGSLPRSEGKNARFVDRRGK